MPYLDNAASTAPLPEVLQAANQAAVDHCANPSAAHALGAAAARALEAARGEIAAWLKADPAEVLFTSGGTEANALGVLGAVAKRRGRHIVVGATEHPAVLRTVLGLAERGYEVTEARPGPDGRLTAQTVLPLVRPDTALVAVMLVNNELGTLSPLAEIVVALRAGGLAPHLHCDAVQQAGLLELDPRALGIDTLALSAHKMHGPKGIGALWIRKGAKIEALWDGGRQEKGRRSGTENLPGAVGFAAAVAAARATPEAAQTVAALRDAFEAAALRELPAARPTVPPGTPRAPHIASVILPGLPAEPLLHALEARGVYASAGSACATRSKGQSHVLAALGVPEADAVLRFSFSRLNTEADAGEAARALAGAAVEVAEVAGPRTAARGRERR